MPQTAAAKWLNKRVAPILVKCAPAPPAITTGEFSTDSIVSYEQLLADCKTGDIVGQCSSFPVGDAARILCKARITHCHMVLRHASLGPEPFVVGLGYWPRRMDADVGNLLHSPADVPKDTPRRSGPYLVPLRQYHHVSTWVRADRYIWRRFLIEDGPDGEATHLNESPLREAFSENLLHIVSDYSNFGFATNIDHWTNRFFKRMYTNKKPDEAFSCAEAIWMFLKAGALTSHDEKIFWKSHPGDFDDDGLVDKTLVSQYKYDRADLVRVPLPPRSPKSPKTLKSPKTPKSAKNMPYSRTVKAVLKSPRLIVGK